MSTCRIRPKGTDELLITSPLNGKNDGLRLSQANDRTNLTVQQMATQNEKQEGQEGQRAAIIVIEIDIIGGVRRSRGILDRSMNI